MESKYNMFSLASDLLNQQIGRDGVCLELLNLRVELAKVLGSMVHISQNMDRGTGAQLALACLLDRDIEMIKEIMGEASKEE